MISIPIFLYEILVFVSQFMRHGTSSNVQMAWMHNDNVPQLIKREILTTYPPNTMFYLSYGIKILSKYRMLKIQDCIFTCIQCLKSEPKTLIL